MIIPTFSKPTKIIPVILYLIPLLLVSMAFYTPSKLEKSPLTNGKPQIRKEIYKNFTVSNGSYELKRHTETEYNVYGKIIQFAEYNMQMGKSVLQRLKIHKYDQADHLIGTMLYNKKNELIWSEEIILDNFDRPKRINRASYDLIHRHTYTLYEYDDFGNEILVQTFDEKKEQTSEKQKNYDEHNELVASSDWKYILINDKLVKRVSKITYTYNNRGQLEESLTETQEGRNKWKEIRLFENNFVSTWHKYKNGKLISKFRHEKRDTITIQRQYLIHPTNPYEDPFRLEYDDAKRDPLQYIDHTPIRTTTIKTDGIGNIIKKVVREHNQVLTVTYFFYDVDNNLTRQKKIHKTENWAEEILNIYDKYHNLIKESSYFESQLVGERSFRYEYYD